MIKSILLLAGSFTFAFLLGEMVHDTGHFLCHMAYGNVHVQVHFDPFGGTHIIGAGHLPAEILAITSAAGPLTNLALGLASFFLFWKIRRPMLLPLLILGPVAMIQEGVTFSLGLLTPGGDAEWISTLGIPQPIILVVGILLLVGGLGALTLILPLAGVEHDDSPRRNLFIVLVSMCSLMMVRSAHSFLAVPESTMENLIPLVFSLLLAAIVVLAHPPAAKIADRMVLSKQLPVTWSASWTAMALGMSMFIFQIVGLN